MTATLTPPQRERILRAATSAPSKYNTQPWWFRWAGDDLDVHVDPTRTLPRSDPANREAHIACGAAVFSARLGYASYGIGTVVDRLPDNHDPLFAARVRVTADAPDPRLATLYELLPHRHTNREPFRDEPIPLDVVAQLREAARAEEAQLRIVTWEPEYEHLLTLVREATGLEEEELQEERAHWVDAADAADRHEGVPAETLGPLPDEPTGAVRDLAVGRDIPDRGGAMFEKRPTIAVLDTRTDTRYDWLAAGEALQRVLLTGTEHGVSASFANQALEDPDLRLEAGRIEAERATAHAEPTPFRAAQMVLRLGLGAHEGHRTPRRALTDVMGPPRETV